MWRVMLSSASRPPTPGLGLLVIAVVFAILNADITTVNVALVTLGKDLHADLGDLQWGLNSYMLAFAASVLHVRLCVVERDGLARAIATFGILLGFQIAELDFAPGF
jgi:MFS family permease